MHSTRLAALFLAIAPAVLAQSLNGLWDATVQVNGLDIPFRMEFSSQGTGATGTAATGKGASGTGATGTAATGTFFNGEERLASTAGRFENGALTLGFDYYAAKLEASLQDGVLQGTYTRAGRPYPFRAKRFAPSPLTEADVPAIAGLWEVGVKSAKGESAWRLIVRQSGPEATAAILRVDGDTGTLAGTYRDGKFVLSHFSGARPLLLELTPREDGTLKVVQNGKDEMTAVRTADARAKGLPQPTDPSRHTSVKDPTEPLRFSAPDLDGHIVSNTDRRFQNKVVIVAIGGSWCPNCHDEAPFLVELYRKYRSRGLEIVALSFEEAEQLNDPTRLRAFIGRYGITYPVLLAGQQSELNDKLPQAVNLNAWPTTFFLGRDGRVRSVHAGFAGAASGQFHQQLKEEVNALVERLLAENTVTQAK